MPKALPLNSLKSISAEFEQQPELRTLMLLPIIPTGCMTFQVHEDSFHPHLRRGEFAVVDLTDHQPQLGEIYLIAYSSARFECGLAYKLCVAVGRMNTLGPGGWSDPSGKPAMCWYAHHGMPPRSREEREHRLRTGTAYASEGPLTTEYFAEKLVGRVVGIFAPVIGEARAAASKPEGRVDG